MLVCTLVLLGRPAQWSPSQRDTERSWKLLVYYPVAIFSGCITLGSLGFKAQYYIFKTFFTLYFYSDAKLLTGSVRHLDVLFLQLNSFKQHLSIGVDT